MPESDGYDDFIDMEGEPGEGESGGGEPKGIKKIFSGSFVRILLYVAAAIIVVIIAVIAGSIAGKKSSSEEVYKRDKAALKEKKAPLGTFNLKQFMANTADTDSTHLVRIKLQLAYARNNLKLQTELNARRTQVRDLILLFFNDKVKDDMDTAMKKKDLKRSLINEINKILIEGYIEDIYYEEFSVN